MAVFKYSANPLWVIIVMKYKLNSIGALNSDGLAHIMNYLDENDLCNFAATCKQLYIQTLNDNYLWKNLYQSKFNDLPPCEINSQNVYSLYKTRYVRIKRVF